MGVASTKAFTTQLALLTLLALHLGRVRNAMSNDAHAELVQGLRTLPRRIAQVLAPMDRSVEELAGRWYESSAALYLGRGPLYPVALEGALKLKEIADIHAHGYPAGDEARSHRTHRW
jgi:glucosamine--fructose-6-phosphate aminotransferase (isomerizing)